MCGISGFWGDFSSESLATASRSIAHRGPDGDGQWHDLESGVGLAHRRLSILDLSSAGAQPMIDEDAVLVFNGEIYNFQALRGELEAKGHRFVGHSDTEVLLKLYIDQGEAMLARLNGIFAFALWDRRNRSLFLARDALGVKPLYYAQGAAGFAFASEIKALLQLLPEGQTLDYEAIHRYLSFLWCPGDATPLSGVRKLSPGEAMLLREGRLVRRWPWYRLPIFQGFEGDLTEQASIERLEQGLRQAVHKQLAADAPVGAFLSGGLDSSSIVAFARELTPDIACFSIDVAGGQEAGETDDLPYARRIADHLNVPLHVVQIDAGRMAADLERSVLQLDEPLADPAALNVFYISRLAREQGIKVLLSGGGGDDLLTGYRRHLALHYEHYGRFLPETLLSGLERFTAGLDQRKPWFRRLAKLFDGMSLTGDARLIHYFVWAKESRLLSLYTPEFRAHLGCAAQPMLDFLKPLAESVQPLDKMLALEQRFFLADHNLNYTDKMSMAAGVEVRLPFLDVDLVELAARIPLDFKQRGRVGKWVLKKAMAAYLPKEVIHRPKSGFGAPLRRWMRHELRPLLGDYLSVESLKRRGLFDAFAVQRLIEKNDRGQVDAAYTLLSLLMIEIWCRMMLDVRRGDQD